jgi:hypothetical protein
MSPVFLSLAELVMLRQKKDEEGRKQLEEVQQKLKQAR